MGSVVDTASLLMSLRARGAKFAMVNGKLKVDAPTGLIGPEQLEILRQRKAEIAALLLSKHPAPNCPGTDLCGGCYEISPGVYLHPPKTKLQWTAWLKRWTPGTEVLQ
jgi:hypothetical protein